MSVAQAMPRNARPPSSILRDLTAMFESCLLTRAEIASDAGLWA
jgi:hypothetical protein